VTYALGAGEMFNVNASSEYAETIVAKCIDQYVKKRVHNEDCDASEFEPIDARLEAIVEQMFSRCFEDRQYKQAVGLALETRRMDMFESAITKSDDVATALSYAFKASLSLIQNRKFRHTVHRTLVTLYMNLGVPDYISVCQCYIFLDDAQAVAEILEKLLQKTEESVLMAYQIGFDLYESATQDFLQRVLNALRKTAQPATAASDKPADDSAMDVDETSKATTETVKVPTQTEADRAVQDRLKKLEEILSGDTTIALHLQFLIRSNKADLQILKNTKDAVRNSVCHNATVIANALMHCGTTSDQFLRDNLEWLARATNWAKFTATASLGVIHKGHEKEALHLMSTYLPKETGPGSVYSEGGGLYALGLIHANHGGEIIEYLLSQLRDTTSDVVRHGGCLGLGLAAMGTARQDVYDQLKHCLELDEAVAGEAAGIAIGLVKLGTCDSTAITDMLTYARESQHEKILRGLAIGIALTLYGRLEEADPYIDELLRDKDPILRWAGASAIAAAYAGTANNGAVRRLLHMAVSDVADDVRRAAVSALGFILFRTPEQCPTVVSLLAESYNPHVRYGAALALGVACAGTGLKEAVTLLETLCNDPVSYVRQGALVASALVLVEHNESTCPRVGHFRQLYSKVIADKHEDVMAKFGAILAQGIIDASGRNVTVSLQSRSGHTNMAAIVGLLVFNQFWYWYPLSHFLSLAFTPTAIIGLNVGLSMPKIEFRSSAKPSTFAYPPPLEEKKDKSKEKVETAVLSTTARQKKKEAEKKKDEKMDVDEEKKDNDKEKDRKDADKTKDTAAVVGVDKNVDKTKDNAAIALTTDKNKDLIEKSKDSTDKSKDVTEKKDETEKKEVAEPSFEMITNPARVMKAQLRVMSLPPGSRYVPLKDISVGGIIMLKNVRPTETEDIIELVAAGGPKVEEEAEPEPPEPFEYIED
jgi:26S proteasome regulatory subunit N2